MTLGSDIRVPLKHLDRFFVDGRWVAPSTGAMIDVIEPATEQLYYRVAEARASDVDRAVGAAATAFHDGPWPRMSHAERAGHLRALAEGLRRRVGDASEIWPRESGVLHAAAQASLGAIPKVYEYYAGLAETFDWTERAESAMGAFAQIVKEPPWAWSARSSRGTRR
ncbi:MULTISPECIES: aldehyde dehydrogenase family protein [Pseudonocardia]|uniref:Geranial dehydrogenase n=2 Tax=Pseudonocardia TaxID=1847 RepID=A0A1Y2MJQ8_PSEAH|nr:MULTISPECIES: aldehyde dehydrogenase family protein [Pseudonocardia]OSY35239.1 Geranial dehydrogenase [Pseudonocardia autotrophica]BBG03883.1 hypothetical protein Pdca_50920 [Pseudonocardia autotrophica]GEC28298.1 hypothetical protein PSA01_53270 [Pseudonocardia saturnea]